MTYNDEPISISQVCMGGECEFDTFVTYLKKQRYPGSVTAVCAGEESPNEFLGPKTQSATSNFIVGEPIMALPVQAVVPKHKVVAPPTETQYSINQGASHKLTPEEKQILKKEADAERRIAEQIRVAQEKLTAQEKQIEEAEKRLAEEEKKLHDEKVKALLDSKQKQHDIEMKLRD